MSDHQQARPGAQGPRETPSQIGRYRIVRPLGRGAMGVVYLANDPLLERDVALKVMVSQVSDDPELSRRFAREAKAVARMTHPNVVTVYDLGEHTDGSPYIAMELLKGQDLARAMRTPPPLSLERKVFIMLQVLAGLGHAHQAGIVHRDIKPANIFLNDDGGVKIMDFGVARLSTASMTGTGNIIGTADYMSPEQVRGARVDGRSDLFSVGCVLYEVVAGRRPFHAENLMAIFYKITHEEPDYQAVPADAEHRALLPILRKALSRDLEQRYQTAYDFAVDLREYLRSWSAPSAAHALEDLVQLEPQTSPPQPLTDAPGVATAPGPEAAPTAAGRTEPARTVDSAPTAMGAVTPTHRMAAEPTVVVAQPERRPRPRVAPRPVPVAEAPRSRAVPIAAGTAAVVVGAAAAWLLFGPKPSSQPLTEPTAPPATSLAAAPPVTTAPPPVTAPPVTTAAKLARPTPAPRRPDAQPTPVTPSRAALAVSAAQAALAAGDHDRAVAEARAALAAEPGHGEARRLLDSALAAQKAAEEQRAQRAAQQRRQQQLAAQVGSFLNQADAALAANKYDGAIALYDEALKLDGGNTRAQQGRSAAIAARAIAQASAAGAARPPAGKTFVSAKTVAQSAETRASGAAPPGFDSSPEVKVKQGSQAADLPGRIGFEIDPAAVKGGERYRVKIWFTNEGTAPIQISEMIVRTKVNGRGVGGAVPPLTRDVHPQQRALLRELPDLWREDTTSWSMEVVVRTTRSETYRNQVSWQ